MMKAQVKKFYAVKQGRETGIFLTWEECKKQVWGYQNALFRSFTTREDAYAWLDQNEKLADPTSCTIYTDGSHQREQDYLGIGAWCQWKEDQFEFSARVTKETLESYGIPINSEVSNPTAEFLAFAEIIKKFEGRTLKTPITFISDYIGVKNWMTGTWKASEMHIKLILKRCQEIMKTIKGDISFGWVKGHSGNDGNNNADRLAGSHDEVDTFALLVPLL